MLLFGGITNKCTARTYALCSITHKHCAASSHTQGSTQQHVPIGGRRPPGAKGAMPPPCASVVCRSTNQGPGSCLRASSIPPQPPCDAKEVRLHML